MSIDLTKILLREKSNPNYVAKGSSLTWDEEDTNFILLGDAVRELQVPSDSGFSPYDNSKTYSNDLPDYVSYNGNIYEYIKAFPQSGIIPGSDPLTWQVASVGQFSHQQNTDQFVDFGGLYQASAQEIYQAIHRAPEDQIFKGNWIGTGSPPPTYLSGDFVYHAGQFYTAINDNTNSEPGVGSDWDIAGVDESSYGPGWAFSTLVPTEGAIYAEVEAFKATVSSFYLKLDGTNAMLATLNVGGFDIEHIQDLYDKSAVKSIGVDARTLFNDWLINNRLFIGVYGSLSETMGGLAYIQGNAIAADPVHSNIVTKTKNDTGQFIRMIYNRGISFHTNLTGPIGTQYSDEDNERLLIRLSGNISVNGNISDGSDTASIDTNGRTLNDSSGSVLVSWDSSSAALEIDSTTKPFLPPRMTTTQKNAIASPVAGSMVFDTTLNKLCVYGTSSWETITSI